MEPSYLMYLFAVYAFLWGAVWGSFLNVVIWRLPEGMSLSKPGSHCPACKTPIRWYDNVPILGWLRLRGRCRACDISISARYPAIELLVACLSLALWLQISGGGRLESEPIQVLLVPFLLRFYFIAILVVITFIDLDHTIIPHELTIPGMVLGVVGAVLMPKTGAWVHYFPMVDVFDSVIGLVAGFGVIALIFYGYAFVTGRVGMGGGDATMLGLIGANLGWQSLLFVMLFSALQGLAAAVLIAAWERYRGTEAGAEGSTFLKGAHRPEFWEERDAAEAAAKAQNAVDVASLGGAKGAEPMANQGDARIEDPGQSGPVSEVQATEADASNAAPPHAPEDDAQQDDAEEEDEGFMKLALPYGPFLALAAVEYYFFGEPALRWFTAGAYP